MNTPDLNDYVVELFGGEDPLLRTIRDEAESKGIPSIQVPFGLGRLLQTLIVVSHAQRVLEIGTLFGYSAILMARALPEGGRILTLEASSKHAQAARENFERAGVADKLELREGAALELLAALKDASFDFVFIDADKASYPEYLEFALQLSHPGTVIVADNVWRDGKVATGSDSDSERLAEFNRRMARDERLLSIIVPRLNAADAASISVVR